MPNSIAIDGPAGAGKSTIARVVAGELGFIYVDTGAMYRAMALFFLRNGIGPEDTERIREASGKAQISLRYRGGEQAVLLDGEDVSGLLRLEAVGRMASASSAEPAVRTRLVELQRALAAESDVVMDGRDIGTVVLPRAVCKIYLTASVEVRAMRRYTELLQKGEAAELEAIKRDIAERDHRDMTREYSPLCQAEDAVLLDSSALSIREVADAIIHIYREKTGSGPEGAKA